MTLNMTSKLKLADYFCKKYQLAGQVLSLSNTPGIFNPGLHCRSFYQKTRARRIKFTDNVDAQYQSDCETLQVPENCDEGQVRSAFIKLAKKYHPDGGGSEANAVKFNQVDAAYKNMLKKFADERHNQHKIEGEYGLYYEAKKKKVEKQEVEEEDIKHTAPQHRQYLSFGGFGFGSPSTREKQYQKYRAVKAVSNVHEHRVQQAIKENPSEETAVVKDKRASKKILTSFGMDRMVEDMIQESMARGEFNNLSGQGKPLKHDSSYNPYIDFTTHKLNQVLIENGFTPEWILLEKEIRQEMADIRDSLFTRRHKYEENLTISDKNNWQGFLQELKPTCDQLNVKIQKYNLLVPSIHKQIFCIQLDREATKAVSKFSREIREAYLNSEKKGQENLNTDAVSQSGETLVGYLMSVLKK